VSINRKVYHWIGDCDVKKKVSRGRGRNQRGGKDFHNTPISGDYRPPPVEKGEETDLPPHGGKKKEIMPLRSASHLGIFRKQQSRGRRKKKPT